MQHGCLLMFLSSPTAADIVLAVVDSCEKGGISGTNPRWGTVHAEIKAPFARNPEQSQIPSSKPGTGECIA